MFGNTTGHTNKDFKELLDIWSTLDKTSWSTLILLDRWMAIRRTFVLEKLKEFLVNTSQWLREDYKEAAEIAYVLLGGQDIAITFRKPGAFHHARWMANILYYGKMLLFNQI